MVENGNLKWSRFLRQPAKLYSVRWSCFRALAPWRVRLQSTGHSALRDDQGPLFALRPDAVIETPRGPIVLDTKWKKLASNGERELGVVQGDVYQMLVYGRTGKRTTRCV